MCVELKQVALDVKRLSKQAKQEGANVEADRERGHYEYKERYEQERREQRRHRVARLREDVKAKRPQQR